MAPHRGPGGAGRPTTKGRDGIRDMQAGRTKTTGGNPGWLSNQREISVARAS